MKAMLFAAVAALSFVSCAEGLRVPLWPEGRTPDFQPHQIGAMTDEAKTNADWRAAHRMP